MKRNSKDEYDNKHTYVNVLGIPVDKAYNNKERHENAGYYGFNIDVKYPECQHIKKTIKCFDYRVSRRYLSSAAVTFTSQHQPAENRYQINRSDLGTAGHAMRSFFLFLFGPSDTDNGFAQRQPDYDNIEEASDSDAEQKYNGEKHDDEPHACVRVVEHVCKVKYV